MVWVHTRSMTISIILQIITNGKKKTPIILFKQSVETKHLLTISFLQYDFGNNLHTVTWICNFSTWEVEAEESGV